MADLIFSGDMVGLEESLAGLLNDAAGRVPGPALKRIMHGMGEKLLELVRADFRNLSAGGVSERGYKWAAHALSTKMKRLKAEAGGSGPGLMTDQQHRRWKKLYWKRFHYLVTHGSQHRVARQSALRYAWWKIQEEGYVTLAERAARTTWPLLYDKGDYYLSLIPGQPGNVLRVDDDQFTIGSSEKPWHEKGTKRMPARPVLPRGDIPYRWWQVLAREYAKLLKEELYTLAQRRARR